MVGKVSFYQTHQNISRAITNNNREKNMIANQLSTGERLQELRQDPMAAAKGSRLSSALARREVYVDNNRSAYATMKLSEGYVQQSVDILQRAREVAVRTANGTFTTEDRGYMAVEINQLIEELGNMANSQDGEGRYLFGGARSNIPPFRLLRTASSRMNKDVITQVEYIGSNKSNVIAVSDHDTIENGFPGSEIFWSRQTTIGGTREVLNYAVPEDSVIEIDNVKIQLNRGDSINSIVKKINDSAADMKASINNFTGLLQLEGTEKRQIWISDAQGQVMEDLGIINGTSAPPYNLSGEANVFEENLFDSLIQLRDAMYDSNYTEVGGKALAGIDSGMNTVFESLAKIGAVMNRLDYTYERIERRDIPALTAQLDDEIAIDVAESIVKFQELVTAQNAAYQVSSKLMETSLLQYLK